MPQNWQREEGVAVPEGAIALFRSRTGEILTVASSGIYRLEGDWAAKQADVNVFGLHIPLPEQGGRFASTGPPAPLRPLESAAFDPKTGRIAAFDGYRLVIFDRDDKGRYRAGHDVKFDRKQFGRVALTADQVFLALNDGQVRCYSPTLEPLEPLDSPITSMPASAIVSVDERYLAVLYRNERLWLYDLLEKKTAALPFVGQGEISAATFADGKLYLADRVTRVTEYDLATQKMLRQWQGPMPLAEKLYRYLLRPLYTVFPKPGQLNDTVNHVLTAGDEQTGRLRLDNPELGPAKFDVWGPVWSNLAFLIVVLAISCVYVSRKDF